MTRNYRLRVEIYVSKWKKLCYIRIKSIYPVYERSYITLTNADTHMFKLLIPFYVFLIITLYFTMLILHLLYKFIYCCDSYLSIF